LKYKPKDILKEGSFQPDNFAALLSRPQYVSGMRILNSGTITGPGPGQVYSFIDPCRKRVEILEHSPDFFAYEFIKRQDNPNAYGSWTPDPAMTCLPDQKPVTPPPLDYSSIPTPLPDDLRYPSVIPKVYVSPSPKI
jgi:hypothetical protein